MEIIRRRELLSGGKYKWIKSEIASVTKYVLEQATTQSYESYPQNTYLPVSDTLNVDENTGQISMPSPTSMKIPNIPSNSYVSMSRGAYKFKSYGTGSGNMYNVYGYRITSKKTTVPGRGTDIGYVYSNDLTAYPADGSQDGYWYTLVE